jgi:hypothetical protein
MTDTNNITKLLTALIGPFRDLENALQQLLTQRFVSNAVGAQLDVLGEIVGQERAGMTDTLYRRYINAKILANKSDGFTETLISIAVLIMNDPNATIDIQTVGYPGYTAVWDVDPPQTGFADALITMLNLAQAAGVRGILQTLTASSDAGAFTCAQAAFLTATTNAGATTLTVGSTSGFPTSGSLDIDVGLTTAETVTYTGTGPTSFTGVSATTQNHAATSRVSLHGSPGLGFPNVAIASTTLSTGATTINVDSTANFLSSGSLCVDPENPSVTEVVTYGGKTSTSFTTVSPLANNHGSATVAARVYPGTVANGGQLDNARSAPLGANWT